MLGMYYITLGAALQQLGDRKQALYLYELALGLGRDGSELNKYHVALALQNSICGRE